MSEKTDYKILKRAFKHPDRIDRIENLVSCGMPDVNYCINGVEGWIEMKSAIERQRSTSKLLKHKLSQAQMNWFLKQRNAGGNAFILICTEKRWMLMHGHVADQINDLTADHLWQNTVWKSEKPITKEALEELRVKLTW